MNRYTPIKYILNNKKSYLITALTYSNNHKHFQDSLSTPSYHEWAKGKAKVWSKLQAHFCKLVLIPSLYLTFKKHLD